MEDIKKLHNKLNIGLVNLSELTENALEIAEKVTRERMTDDEFVRYETFKNKLIDLTLKGKHKEVEALKKAYLKENG
jgi:hypothetical protein